MSGDVDPFLRRILANGSVVSIGVVVARWLDRADPGTVGVGSTPLLVDVNAGTVRRLPRHGGEFDHHGVPLSVFRTVVPLIFAVGVAFPFAEPIARAFDSHSPVTGCRAFAPTTPFVALYLRGESGEP